MDNPFLGHSPLPCLVRVRVMSAVSRIRVSMVSIICLFITHIKYMHSDCCFFSAVYKYSYLLTYLQLQ